MVEKTEHVFAWGVNRAS